ncbi:MAG TPA: cytochrome c oxidase subunit 3 [Acidimicrobiales bacterium]|nr:cytochrome c oxidase subunit 3 [Acidimicrobiales bacterium]
MEGTATVGGVAGDAGPGAPAHVRATTGDEFGVTTASPLAVGVIVWLASELMFFAGLFAAYFVLRSGNDPWPPAGVELDIPRALLSTVLLLASSATMHLAVRAGERGDHRGVGRWLAVTLVLGTLFLANLALEWAGLEFSLDTDAYGSIYYLITGFHGLHVLGGLVLMVAVAGLVLGRDSEAPVGPSVAVTGYYWHFVDLVWIFVFVTIYLLR